MYVSICIHVHIHMYSCIYIYIQGASAKKLSAGAGAEGTSSREAAPEASQLKKVRSTAHRPVKNMFVYIRINIYV